MDNLLMVIWEEILLFPVIIKFNPPDEIRIEKILILNHKALYVIFY